MTTPIQNARRVFQYSSLDLPDPDPAMTPEAVKDYYTVAYPELVNATVDPGEFNGTALVFKIRRAVGTKG